MAGLRKDLLTRDGEEEEEKALRRRYLIRIESGARIFGDLVLCRFGEPDV